MISKSSRWHSVVFTAIMAIAILAATACGSGQHQRGMQGTPEVGVITVKTERVVLSDQLPGRTAAFLTAEIRPQVSGLIQKRLFNEGAEVKAGDVLYQIDPSQYQATYDQAKAAVAMSEATLPALRARAERFKGLVEIKAVGQQDYDDAVAALQQAEAQLMVNKASLKQAEINLSYTPIKAPISGRIGRSNVTVGAMVTAYQPLPLATVQQLDPIYVDVTQSAAELLRLKQSIESGELDHNGGTEKQVKLVLEDGTPYPLEGTLQFRDVTVEPTTGSVILRAVFPNPDATLLPGMFVQAIIEEGVREQAILLPQQAVTRDHKGNPLCMVVNAEGALEQRPLKLNRTIGDKWLVSSGITAGETVVLDGLQKVRPGMKVKTVPAGQSGNSNPAQSGK